jgi:HD-like signal output (HDOD) protein
MQDVSKYLIGGLLIEVGKLILTKLLNCHHRKLTTQQSMQAIKPTGILFLTETW